MKSSKPLNFEPKNIIIRMPNWLGDLVMATPILEDVKTQWPSAKITAMCQSNVAGMLKENPYINEIFSFKKPNGWLPRDKDRDILTTLRHGNYDLGILLTNSFSSALWFWRGNVNYRVGYTGHFRSLLLSNAVSYPKNIESQHLVITYKMLLEHLGVPLSETKPTLYVSEKERKAAQDLLASHGIAFGDIVVGINPGAAFGSAKCWLPDRFRAVTQKLMEFPHVKVVYFGDQAGLSLVNDICAEMPDRVVNLAAKTNLRELIALIQLCNVFLTNDSGPMHIAAALGTPLLALFGSTSDVKTGPYLNGKVIHKRVECSPCYKRECPIDFRCMRSITSNEVFHELQTMIDALNQR